MESSTFERSLTETRHQLGMSQRQLAAALGMSPTTIGHYEAGRHSVPRYVHLAMLALWHRLDGLPPAT